MSLPKGQSGQHKAKAAVDALRTHLAAHEAAGTLPALRHGAINVKALCGALKVGRATANQNPAFRDLLDTWSAQMGLESIGAAHKSDAQDSEEQHKSSFFSDESNNDALNKTGDADAQDCHRHPARSPVSRQDQETITHLKHSLKQAEKALAQETKRANTLEKRLAHVLAQNTHLHTRLRQQAAREVFLTERGRGTGQ